LGHINAQVAARMVRALIHWKQLEKNAAAACERSYNALHSTKTYLPMYLKLLTKV